jgi:hypothetical protein
VHTKVSFESISSRRPMLVRPFRPSLRLERRYHYSAVHSLAVRGLRFRFLFRGFIGDFDFNEFFAFYLFHNFGAFYEF